VVKVFIVCTKDGILSTHTFTVVFFSNNRQDTFITLSVKSVSIPVSYLGVCDTLEP
jgi:hypothetical protein